VAGHLPDHLGPADRFVSTYFAKYNKDPDSKDWRDWPYFAGDGAVQTEDGYFRILGRVDDVINVAGHRLGTKELESSALAVQEVAEAAAVRSSTTCAAGRSRCTSRSSRATRTARTSRPR